MGAEDASGGGGVEDDGDADASLMSRLTEMKLAYRDVVSHNAQQVLARSEPTCWGGHA